jgi:eukaryotic-like serine/threonine-protein kinase
MSKAISLDLSSRKQLDTLLDAYLDLAEAARERWLAQISQQYPELYPHLQRLVSNKVLTAPDGPGSARLANGTRVGPWRVLRHVGQGGSADVYCAERADGRFERQVAIKCLRASGLRWSRSFDNEQKLLARLQHPNIASLLDAGSAPDGLRYFVMPWLEGKSFNAIDWTRVELVHRLDYFAQIAQAIAYAHGQLVVHSDLKPSNVIRLENLGSKNGKGSALVLDFGIARLLDTEQTQLTSHAMTPAYASPEQLQGEAPSVASDLHGLGLILYELLCARPAYPDAHRSLAHAVQSIVHGQPEPFVPTGHGISRAQRLDLEAITLKLLEKSPHRRYLSVDALLHDLHAVAAHKPVTARSRSLWGYTQSLIRRYRLAFAAAGVTSALLVIGVATYVQHNQKIAAERAEALLQVKRLESLREHFTLILREGVSGNPGGAKQALDESVRNLANRFQDAPAERAQLLLGLGELYVAAGDYQAARSTLQPLADGAQSLLTASQRGKFFESYVNSLLRISELDEAATQLARWTESVKGKSHANAAENRILQATLMRMQGQGAEALRVQSDGVAMLMQADDATELNRGIAQANLGTAYFATGDFQQATLSYNAAIARWQHDGLLRNDNVVTAETNLAHILMLQGQPEAALKRYQSLRDELSARGSRSPAFAALLIGLARAHALIGKLEEGISALSEAKSMLADSTGTSGMDYLGALLNEFDLQTQINPSANADALINQIDSLLQPLPHAHPLRSRFGLNQAYRAQLRGDTEKAKQMLSDVQPNLESLPPSLQALRWRAVLLNAELNLKNAIDIGAINNALTQATQLQGEAGLDAQELTVWQACLANSPNSGTLSQKFSQRLSPGHPRARALLWCDE